MVRIPRELQLKEIKARPDDPLKAYSYEVANIKLLSPHHHASEEIQGTTQDSSSISSAKLLNNVEKSYQPGKFLIKNNETEDQDNFSFGDYNAFTANNGDYSRGENDITYSFGSIPLEVVNGLNPEGIAT